MDFRSPTEDALLPPCDLEGADLSDYREELVLSLSSAREHAVSSVREVQKWYKRQYDRKARAVPLRCGDWALVRFPQDKSGKQRKLSRLWHGPYRVTAINEPDVTLVKVYFPEGPIQVHLSRVCPCPHSYQLVSIGTVVTAGALVEYHSGWDKLHPGGE